MTPARQALLTYGEHLASCSYWTDRPTCSCGLDAALRELSEHDHPRPAASRPGAGR